MINFEQQFEQQAADLEQQQEAEANSIKAEFEQILRAVDANVPEIKNAEKAKDVASEQITPILKAAAVTAATPAARPAPGSESYEEEV